jgi:hypothetical protein
MVIAWFKFLLRQLAISLVIVTSILLLSEILLPSSVLPYFNLHILILVTLFIAVASPMVEEKSRVMRYALCATLTALLLLYAWLIFGMSASGLMLLAALAILLVGSTIALCHPAKGDGLRDAESGGPRRTPLSDSVRLLPLSGENVTEEIIEIVTVEEEIDVFMR